MRNQHDIHFRKDQPVRRVLNNFGVEVDADFALVSIYEDDPKWPCVKSLIAKYECTDVCVSYFSDAELTASKWLRMVRSRIQQYRDRLCISPMEDERTYRLSIS